MLPEIDPATFQAALWAWMGLAVVTALVLTRVTAPYGRHGGAPGPRLPSGLGWVLMEAPSFVGMALLYAVGDNHGVATTVFLGLWLLHYGNRTVVYPLARRSLGSPLPLFIALQGAFFNVINAGTNGLWLFRIGPDRDAAWLGDPRFLVGLALFLGGLALNVQSDEILRRLRRPGERGYRVPEGGLYRWVSCPNYLGEIIEWWGFALLTWSVSGLAFAVWTTANLLPRALAHHAWYLSTFPDYPPERRAVLPGLL